MLDFDHNPGGASFYHGHDFQLPAGGTRVLRAHLDFLERALDTYDVFHFSNAHALAFGELLQTHFADLYHPGADIELLRARGKKIVYSNNGCLDGVSQTSFGRWDTVPACSICPFRDDPRVCSDERNLAWGEFRNDMADLQATTGGNRADFNNDARVHEIPEFYCLDPELWRPDLRGARRAPRRDPRLDGQALPLDRQSRAATRPGRAHDEGHARLPPARRTTQGSKGSTSR